MFISLVWFFFLNSASAYFLNEEECLNYTVYPVQYELTLFPQVLSQDNSYYDCDLTITVIANVPNVRRIELDAKDLEINRESVHVLNQNELDIINSVRPYEYDKRAGKIYLYLKEDLEPYSLRNVKYYIKISFRKFLKGEQSGIFVVTYDENGHKKHMLTTRLSPNKAKHFFPCFEHPQFEAGFLLKVVTSGTQRNRYNTSLFIAEELRRSSQKDDSTVIQYIPSPQVAVYQVGFHHSDFASKAVSAKYTNDTLILWAPGSQLSNYKYILRFGQSILQTIHEYSTVKRPLVNGPINLVAVPADLKGYESGSWNLLTIANHKLAFSPQYTSIKQKEEISYLLTQQLCRVWLGNPGERERTRWQQEWFKEGMATYLGYYFLSQSGNSFQDMSVYGSQLRNKAMTVDWRPETPTLASFNRTLAIDIPSRYQPLVAWKTASLLRMVEHWLGSDRFHRALVKYINTRRGKFISVEDFATFLEAETVECEFFKGYTASDVLQSWFQQPGYPLLKVVVYRNEGTQDIVYLEQKQFTFSNSSRRSRRYLVPVSYVTQYTENCYNCHQPKFTVDVSGYTFKENLNGGWIVLNRNASGYYRVNYDHDTWKMIINTLNGPDKHRIDPLNRAQIINDAFALYMSGDIEYSLATELLACLESETSAAVWAAALSGFELLKTDGASVPMSRQLYADWKAFMRELISPIYRRLTSSLERDDRTRMFRSLVTTFACSIGHSPCLRDLEGALGQVTKTTYDPDLREICYYMLLNESRGYDSIRPANGFEKEDFVSAEHAMKEEARFLYKLPNESPRPMPYIESTTRRIYVPVSTEKTLPLKHKTSASTLHAASIFTVVSTLLVTILAIR